MANQKKRKKSKLHKKPYEVRFGPCRSDMFATTWLARGWLAVINDKCPQAVIESGRRLALADNLVGMSVVAGEIEASFRGSESSPLKIVISLSSYPEQEWERIFHMVNTCAEARYQLMEGDCPEVLNEMFYANNMHLLPSWNSDLSIACSCDSREVVCEHVVALFHLIAQDLENDPFMMLALRGGDQDQLMDALFNALDIYSSEVPENSAEEIPCDFVEFWGDEQDNKVIVRRSSAQEVHALLVARLGREVGGEYERDVYMGLQKMYEEVSENCGFLDGQR